MKYTAHLKADATDCKVEFEVSPEEVYAFDGEALTAFLDSRAVDALRESGLVDIWFEEEGETDA
jgi:hypothetical protein